MTDGNGDPIRELLLEYSDHRAVRHVFVAYTGGETIDLVDYVEAMRATDGRLALVVSTDVADVYARWNGGGGRYEHVSLWPPWSLGEYGSPTRDELVAYLDSKGRVEAVLHEKTPFVDEQALASLIEEESENERKHRRHRG